MNGRYSIIFFVLLFGLTTISCNGRDETSKSKTTESTLRDYFAQPSLIFLFRPYDCVGCNYAILSFFNVNYDESVEKHIYFRDTRLKEIPLVLTEWSIDTTGCNVVRSEEGFDHISSLTENDGGSCIIAYHPDKGYLSRKPKTLTPEDFTNFENFLLY